MKIHKRLTRDEEQALIVIIKAEETLETERLIATEKLWHSLFPLIIACAGKYIRGQQQSYEELISIGNQTFMVALTRYKIVEPLMLFKNFFYRIMWSEMGKATYEALYPGSSKNYANNRRRNTLLPLLPLLQLKDMNASGACYYDKIEDKLHKRQRIKDIRWMINGAKLSPTESIALDYYYLEQDELKRQAILSKFTRKPLDNAMERTKLKIRKFVRATLGL